MLLLVTMNYYATRKDRDERIAKNHFQKNIFDVHKKEVDNENQYREN